jgi:hypothetical protein
MAFKYKLVKETEVGTTQDVRRFPVANPKTLTTMGAKVDKGAVKNFLEEPANSNRSLRLESDIINSLEVAGFDQFEIEEFMDFLYLTRNRFVGGGKYGEKPLNEEKPKDPIQTFLSKKVQQWNDEERKENPDYGKDKNTFKTDLKERIIKRLKENKKDMLVRASQQKP